MIKFFNEIGFIVYKKFILLLEENIFILDRLRGKINVVPESLFKYSKQQLTSIVRLYISGKSKLKDIASREFTTAPNLCANFRKLEQEGLINREVDENDRRDVWYSLTSKGEELAKKILDNFRKTIEDVFKNISKEDEKLITNSLKIINLILTKMEINND